MRLALSSDSPDSASVPSRLKVGGHKHRHAAQFYDSDAFLIRAVSDYVIAGLQADETAITVLTREHQAACARELAARGVDLGALRQSGALIEIDADQALAAFMENGMPNEERMFRVVLPVLEQAEARSTRVRACGEAISILWSQGLGPAALALEALWSKLLATHPLSLMCFYAMRGFSETGDRSFVSSACAMHDIVGPTEHYTEADEATRLVEIVLLQQQSQAMQSEIRRREELEAIVRDLAGTTAADSPSQLALPFVSEGR